MAQTDADEWRPEGEEDDEGGPIKTFLEHLEDLRWVFIRCVSALCIGMAVCLAGAPKLFLILTKPLRDSNADIPINFFGPLGGFISSMKVALYGGICLSLPFILYFVAQFILPALKKNEKAFFTRAFVAGGGLFISGVLICYFWVLRISLGGMAAYNRWLGIPAEIWRAEEYFSFVTFFLIGMGVCFELPIIVLSLVKVGIVDYKTLRKSRPYFFIGIFGTVAFITPDFISTFFLVIPVLFLLEICIWIAWYWDKRKVAEEAARVISPVSSR